MKFCGDLGLPDYPNTLGSSFNFTFGKSACGERTNSGSGQELGTRAVYLADPVLCGAPLRAPEAAPRPPRSPRPAPGAHLLLGLQVVCVGAVRLVLGDRASPEREADDGVSDEHHHERKEVDEGDHCEVVPAGRAEGLGNCGQGATPASASAQSPGPRGYLRAAPESPLEGHLGLPPEGLV